ncbi:MAG: hypothetical protein J2P17_15435, partial [Mycobacterium sp.]|nr:hypothetical protein [Mycobacterium sp.]
MPRGLTGEIGMGATPGSPEATWVEWAPSAIGILWAGEAATMARWIAGSSGFPPWPSRRRLPDAIT